jgi:hypothetical protein
MNLRAWISDQIEGDGMNDSNLDASARETPEPVKGKENG